MNFIKNNRDLNYKVKIDFEKNINEQELLRETRVILSLIYRDYICDENKKKELLEKEKQELKKIEEINKEKYEIDFEKMKKQHLNATIKENTGYMIEVPKEKWYMKLINKIRKIFYRN